MRRHRYGDWGIGRNARLVTEPPFGVVKAWGPSQFAIGRKYAWSNTRNQEAPKIVQAAIVVRQNVDVVFLRAEEPDIIYSEISATDLIVPHIEPNEVYNYLGPMCNGRARVVAVRSMEGGQFTLVRLQEEGMEPIEFVTPNKSLFWESHYKPSDLQQLTYGCRVQETTGGTPLTGTLMRIRFDSLQADYLLDTPLQMRVVNLASLEFIGPAGSDDSLEGLEAAFISFFSKPVLALVESDPQGETTRTFATQKLPGDVWLPGPVDMPDKAAWLKWFGENRQKLGRDVYRLSGISASEFIHDTRRPQTPPVLRNFTAVPPLEAAPESPQENIVLQVELVGEQKAMCPMVVSRRMQLNLLLPRHLQGASSTVLRQYLSANGFQPNWDASEEVARHASSTQTVNPETSVNVKAVNIVG